MTWIRQLFVRAANLLTRRSLDARLRSEIEDHIALQTEDNIRAGMPAEEARRRAVLKFGAVEAVTEDYRDQQSLPFVENLLRDLRYAVRMLWKAPAFSAVAVIVLALGIGANTAIFSVIDSVLLRPLPVRDADRLVVVPLTSSRTGDYLPDMSYPDYADYKAQVTAFSDMLAYSLDSGAITLSDQSTTHVEFLNYVTGNFFSALGVRPLLGRLIQPEDERNGEVVVLGYSFWKQHLSGDPNIIGKHIVLNGRPVTVIGVAPRQFHGVTSFVETEVYAPLGEKPGGVHDQWTARNEGGLLALAYLKPGVSLAEARASVRVVAARLAAQYPEVEKDVSADVLPERLARPSAGIASAWPLVVSVFLGLAFVVLGVACVNLVNLLLARAQVRAGEIAIRASLGASRSRLMRQLLTESLLLGCMGGAAGLLVSAWCMSLLARVGRPIDIPIRLDFSFDWRIFAYAFAVSILAGTLAGVTPALRASRVRLNTWLHESGRTLTGGRRTHRLRNAMVITQVSGCFVLLIVGGLFLRVLEKTQRMDLGFDPHHVLIAQMDFSSMGLTKTRATEFYDELIREVRALPGVDSAAYSRTRPFGNSNMGTLVDAEGKTAAKDHQIGMYDYVDPQYFSTLRIALLQGRNFAESDNATSPRVAIVNQEMARRFWPNEDALGKRFRMLSNPGGPLIQVIGVAKNAVTNDPTGRRIPYFYLPFTQNYSPFHILNVRSSLDPKDLSAEIERNVHKLMPGLAVMLMTMQDSLQSANGFFIFHLASDIAGAMALIGFIVALVGIYGLISYSAAGRTHEVGIRMALGAKRREVLFMFLRDATVLVGTGLAIGALLALAVAQVMKGLLIGVSPHDPLTFIAVAATLAAAAIFASYVPARHAARLDPMVALRHE